MVFGLMDPCWNHATVSQELRVESPTLWQRRTEEGDTHWEWEGPAEVSWRRRSPVSQALNDEYSSAGQQGEKTVPRAEGARAQHSEQLGGSVASSVSSEQMLGRGQLWGQEEVEEGG